MTEDEVKPQGEANAESAGAPTPPENNENQAPSWHNDVLEYARSNGRDDVASIEDLLKPKEIEVEKIVEKEVDPWADVIDDRTKGYLAFRKETGRDWNDYEALQKDIDAIDPLEIARAQARLELGMPNLKAELADQHIADKLNIDLEDLSEYDNVKLIGYGKPHRDDMKAQQEKYRTPVPKPAEQQAPAYNPEDYVSMPDGSVMTKAQFEERQTKIDFHLKNVREAASALKSHTFTMEIDDNGEKKELPFTYDFPQEETDGMSAFAEELITGKFAEKYRTETGYDYEGFMKGLAVNPILGKIVPTLMQRARAEAIEEVMQRQGNHQFTPQMPVQTQQREGVRNVPFSEIMKGI